MTRALSRRGPDAEGYFRTETINLGHRRLSIIDLQGSQQPISNETATIIVVFNGEIYNFQSVRSDLQNKGYVFRTAGDSEVLVHAYAEYGTSMLQMLEGMFAFAIWDASNNTLFLARDHLGIKPLYYFWDDSIIVFGSELKAVLQHPAVSRTIDLDAVALYLECQFIPAPRTIYKGIKKLDAGHALLFQASVLTEWRYWLPDFTNRLTGSDEELISLVADHLGQSVESMLVSDVPLGAFVSGGIDSSLIAALMTERSGSAIDTFTLGFTNDVEHSEDAQATLVSKHLGSRHHLLMVDPATVLASFESWSDVFDEPFGDQAGLPTLMLAQFARQNVTVVLTGEGADEVFAGYDNYKKRVNEEKIVERLAFKGSPLPAIIRRLPPIFRRDRILKATSKQLSERYGTIPNVFDEALRPTLLSQKFQDALVDSVSKTASRFFDECTAPSYMDKIMYVDTRLWLPDDLLTKVDRATMAYSLEARVPYLDRRLVELAFRIDPETKRRGNCSKYLIKKVAEQYLPSEIVYRRKQGFHMPLRRWLSNELRPVVEEHISAKGLLKRNLFKNEAIMSLLNDHFDGRKDNAIKIWNLLVLERWFKAYEPEFAL